MVFNADGNTLEIFGVADDFPNSLRDLIASWKVTPFAFEPIAEAGYDWISVDALEPDDIRHVGGKAANFGFLRRSIPESSPEAIALTFDVWNRFLDQSMPGGGTLRDWITAKLQGYSWPVTDLPSLYDALDDIRDYIEDESAFDGASIASIYAALEGFDENRNIRFRSSTNMEDSRSFVGAGLYESKSGCLLDDLDGDEVGPSHCDSTEAKERGVFRALRKVYASFYDDNAFLERLRLGVDESKVGMAVLVHHSFPDVDEWANGVATVNVTRWGSNPRLECYLVSQDGAESVTNPEGGGIPEVVRVTKTVNGSTGTYVYLQQASNRVPRGGYVLDWKTEYVELVDLLEKAMLAFDAYGDNSTRTYTLDFEYKKLRPDGNLVVKQIREVPHAEDLAPAPLLFGGEAVEWEVFQGEYGDVFANHRLKTRLGVVFDHRLLDEQGVAESLLRAADYAHVLTGQVTERSGEVTAWPGFVHASAFDDYSDRWLSIDAWNETVANGNVLLTLSAGLKSKYFPTSSPLKHSESMDLVLSATYEKPVPYREYPLYSPWSTRSEELVRLTPRDADPINENDIPIHRQAVSSSEAVSIDIRFWWPPGPGPTFGYTAPLRAWDHTTITGLTSEPLVLTSYYSQTYRPAHHNFGEEFIFEPRLDPGVSSTQRAELEDAGIVRIYVALGYSASAMIETFSEDWERKSVP